jgi:hypothetical protein
LSISDAYKRIARVATAFWHRLTGARKSKSIYPRRSKMGVNNAIFRYDDVPELGRAFVDLEPTIPGLAACLDVLQIEAMTLGNPLAATLIGSARLALLDP